MKHDRCKTVVVIIFVIQAVSLAFISQVSGRSFAYVQQDTVRKIGENRYELSTVTVTATRSERSIYRVPRALDVLQRDAIRRGTQTLSLGESLRYVPGVIVNNRHNLSQGDRILIRGLGSRAQFGVRGIKVLIDGIPLTMPDGQTQLNNLDLNSVGTIEIIRGPSSSLYGNAAGGVINIHTEQIPETNLRIQPSLSFGSYGFNRMHGNVQGRSGAMDYVLNFSQVGLDGFREHSSSQYYTLNALSHFQYTGATKVTALLNNYYSPFLLNPSSLDKSTAQTNPESARNFVKSQGAGKRIWQGQTGLTVNHSIAGDRSFNATVFGFWRDLYNPIPGRIIDLGRIGGGIRLTYTDENYDLNSNFSWIVGADFEIQRDERKEYENEGLPDGALGTVSNSDMLDLVQKGAVLINQDEQVLGIGPFVEFDFSFHPMWSIVAGGRYDYYNFKVTDHLISDNINSSGSRSMKQFSPMIGILFKPDELSNLYFNFSTAFQTPTTTELGNRVSGEGGFNPDLEPERIVSFEAGLKGVLPRGDIIYDFSAYVSDLKDMLIPFQVQSPESEAFFFRNAGKARNRGIEARLQWDKNEWLGISLAYAYMNFTFEDFLVESQEGLRQQAGNKVPGIPPHSLTTNIRLRHPGGFFASIDFRWTDSYFANDANGSMSTTQGGPELSEYINDSYKTIDIRAGFEIAASSVVAEVYLGINNVLDERYNGSIVPNAFGRRFFEPAPGRSWYAGIIIPFSVR